MVTTTALTPSGLGLYALDPMLGAGADFACKCDEAVDGRVLDEIDRRVHAGA